MTDESSEANGLVERLKPALLARYGFEVGSDVIAEVAAVAWERSSELAVMDNPLGFLYRVAQSRARRYHRWERSVRLPPERRIDPDLAGAIALQDGLAALDPDDRTIVVMVHAYGFTYDEVADTLNISHAAVRNRLHRAVRRLRRHLGEN